MYNFGEKLVIKVTYVEKAIFTLFRDNLIF